MKVATVAISSLTPDSRNARTHDGRNIDAIAASLDKFGQRKPIVVTANKMVIAGNGTLKAARKLGWTEIVVAQAPEDWDEPTIRAYALADNRSAELADWDESVLQAILDELALGGWNIEELGFELPQVEPEALTGDPDEVPETVPSKTVLGDVWLLGPHRLVCGDSTIPTDVDKLMNGAKPKCVLTDPPYGISLKTDWAKGGGKDYKPVANDDVPFDATFLRLYFKDVAEQFWWGANYYHRTLCEYDLDGSWLVWDKRTPETDSVVGAGFELCWSAQKHKQDVLRYHWTNYTSHSNAGLDRAHPTEKPVALLNEILNRWADEGCVVVDPFGGSGTTLIAAHQTNRIAYLMELDPHYCDVICARFQTLTGLLPIAESTGNKHDFLA